MKPNSFVMPCKNVVITVFVTNTKVLTFVVVALNSLHNTSNQRKCEKKRKKLSNIFRVVRFYYEVALVGLVGRFPNR